MEMSQAWLGCTFSGMSLVVLKNQLASLNMSLLAQRPSESAATSPATYSNIIPFSGHVFSFALNGIENLKFENFSLNVRNDIEVVHTLNRKSYCSKHHVRGLDISGSITLEFETEAERRRLWGALTATGPQNVIAPGSLTVTATHNDEAAIGYPFVFSINIPELYYESAPANITRQQERVIQKISFKPSWNRNAAEILSMTMRNSVASYPDPL